MQIKRIMHRDIKAANILITLDGLVKIIDFGWSTKLQPDIKCTEYSVGSPRWWAPELPNKRPYDYAVDIWALGITVYELVERKEPFAVVGDEKAKIALKAGKGPPTKLMKKFPSSTRNFYGKTTRKKPSGWRSRPKVQDLAKQKLLKLAEKNPNAFSTLRPKVNAIIV